MAPDTMDAWGDIENAPSTPPQTPPPVLPWDMQANYVSSTQGPLQAPGVPPKRRTKAEGDRIFHAMVLTCGIIGAFALLLFLIGQVIGWLAL